MVGGAPSLGARLIMPRRRLRPAAVGGWLLPSLLACQPGSQEETVEHAQAALDRTTEQHVGTVAPGSPAEAEALARFADLVSDMSPKRTASLVPQVYAEDVWFYDTLKEVHGAATLAEYFRHSLGGAEQVTARVLDVARSGDDIYVRWQMDIRFKKFARGRLTTSTGISHLRFNGDGKIVFHQDHWDATTGFFQYVPVVGGLIGWVKGKL